MKNSDILRAIWRDEIVNSKKRRILMLIGKLCGIKETQAKARMYGLAKTNDAEFFEIIEIFKSNNVNVEVYEDEIKRKRIPYFGGYESVDLD